MGWAGRKEGWRMSRAKLAELRVKEALAEAGPRDKLVRFALARGQSG